MVIMILLIIIIIVVMIMLRWCYDVMTVITSLVGKDPL